MLLFFALRWASRRRRRGPRARERRQRGGKQARPALLFPRRWGRGKNLVLLRRPSSSSLAWRSVKMPASRACLRFRGGAPDWNPQEQSERKTLSSPFSPSPSPLRLLLPLGGNNNKNSSLSLRRPRSRRPQALPGPQERRADRPGRELARRDRGLLRQGHGEARAQVRLRPPRRGRRRRRRGPPLVFALQVALGPPGLLGPQPDALPAHPPGGG